MIHLFFGERLDLRVRLFNVLALTATLFCPVIAIINLVAGNGIMSVLVDLVAALFSGALLFYSSKTGRYRLCYLLTIVVCFFILFPYLFFRMGGYHGGIPLFFVFAIVFTVFMLEGKSALVVTALELVLYLGVYVYAYLHPASVIGFDDNKGYLISNVMDLLIVSAALGFTMFAQINLYRRQQRKLEAQNEALEKINLFKTEFLANVTHELKTPLTVMSGYAQYSQKSLATLPEMAEVENRMKLIASEADRLALMVTQILDVTRIEEGYLSVDLRPASLTAIIQRTVNTYYPVFTKNNNTLKIKRSEDMKNVRCDEARISQILVNLVANAARHTHDGVITISAEAEGSFAVVRVTDTGEGIAPERLPYLFERFKSYANENRKNSAESEDGVGLGLYICKYIVDAHGGEINVRSTIGEGTDVSFTLPFEEYS